jgi:hypothetical protein
MHADAPLLRFGDIAAENQFGTMARLKKHEALQKPHRFALRDV